MNLRSFPRRVNSKTSCLRITVPENLDLALEGLIRKVLKEQPKTDDIHSFAANYFETLLKIRDKAGPKYSSALLCPFHNDEDAHEMIKLAKNFNRPIKKKNQMRNGKSGEGEKERESRSREKEAGKKKPKKTPKKGEKAFGTGEAAKPDLIKTVSEMAGKGVREKKRLAETEVETKTEEKDKLLENDPIKELLEKELMENVRKSTVEPKEEGQKGKENLREESPQNDKTEESNKSEPENVAENQNKTEVKEKNSNVELEGNKNTEETKSITDMAAICDEKSNNLEKVNYDNPKEESIEKYDNAEKTKIAEEHETSIQTFKPEEEEEKKEETHKKADDLENGKTEAKTFDDGHLNEPTETEKELSEDIKEGETNQTEKADNVIPEKAPIALEKEKEISTKNSQGSGNESLQPKTDVQEFENLPPLKSETAESEELKKSGEEYKQSGDINTNNIKTYTEQGEVIADEAKMTAEFLKSADDHEKDVERNQTHLDITEQTADIAASCDVKVPDKETLEGDKGEELEMKMSENAADAENVNVVTISEEQLTAEPNTEMNTMAAEDGKNGKDVTESSNANASSESALKEDIKNEESKETAEEKITERSTSLTEGIAEEEQMKKPEQKPSREFSDSKPENQIENVLPTTENIQDKPEKPTEIQNEQNEQRLTDTPQKDKIDSEEEMCTVVDIQQIPKIEKSFEQLTKESEIVAEKEKEFEQSMTETIQQEVVREEPEEELCTVVDIKHIPGGLDEEPQHEVTQKVEDKELTQSTKDLTNAEEEKTEKENITESQKEKDKEEEFCTVVDSRHIIRVEPMNESEKVSQPTEVQIKTIQTHYYDTLKLPETTAKELRVHSVSALSVPLVASASALPAIKESKDITEETNNPLESVPAEPLSLATTPESPERAKPESHQLVQDTQTGAAPSVEALNHLTLGMNTQRSETDDLLDVMTPSSGYSLNLSELSWQTISGMFLDSERQYSSVELEEVKLAISKSTELIHRSENAEEKPEIEETFHKTVLSSDVRAVPVPPRDEEEINRKASIQISEVSKGESDDKEKKEEKNEERKDEPEKEVAKEEPLGTSVEEESSNGKSIDTYTPLISVEVKTMIESQILDDDVKDSPQVELQIEATVEVQDVEEKTEVEAEKEMSDTKGGEAASTPQETLRNEEDDTSEVIAGKECSSNESDSTASSAVTEIKRSNSGKRHIGSARSLLTSQSLDLGGRNPLLRTRSLSTFRRGVTDFEVWNAIEKELEEAATKIQSKFRSFKNRKKLTRENAVQIATDESSVSTTPAEVERQQSTGEFHDSIVLSDHPR